MNPLDTRPTAWTEIAKRQPTINLLLGRREPRDHIWEQEIPGALLRQRRKPGDRRVRNPTCIPSRQEDIVRKPVQSRRGIPAPASNRELQSPHSHGGHNTGEHATSNSSEGGIHRENREVGREGSQGKPKGNTRSSTGRTDTSRLLVHAKEMPCGSVRGPHETQRLNTAHLNPREPQTERGRRRAALRGREPQGRGGRPHTGTDEGTDEEGEDGIDHERGRPPHTRELPIWTRTRTGMGWGMGWAAPLGRGPHKHGKDRRWAAPLGRGPVSHVCTGAGIQTRDPFISSSPNIHPHDMHSHRILGKEGDSDRGSGRDTRLLWGGEPLASGKGQVRDSGGMRGQSRAGEVGTHGATVREGDRDSVPHDALHHSPHRGSILHRWRRDISHSHTTEGEADAEMAHTQRGFMGLPLASIGKRAGAEHDLTCHATCMGGSHLVLRSGTLVSDIDTDQRRTLGHMTHTDKLGGTLIGTDGKH